jgi:hypothetical protein
VVLTDLYHANDTYATESPNDIDSELKTFARFLHRPETAKAGRPLPLTGMAQVGMAGLKKVQYWIAARGVEAPGDDLHFVQAPWRDAEILAPPAD